MHPCTEFPEWVTKSGMQYLLPEAVTEGKKGMYKIVPPCFKGCSFDLKVGYVEVYLDDVLVRRPLVMVQDTQGYVNRLKTLGYVEQTSKG